MTFLTYSQAYAATSNLSHGVITKSLQASAAQRLDGTFDIFMSHSIHDARAIDGIRRLLVSAGLTVYVDWIDDPQLDRSHVTPEVAEQLRQRMQQAQSMIYVTSPAASTSIWMPWELGYFDGRKPGHVGLLPLVREVSQNFLGQEYLGLYPLIEQLSGRLGVQLSDGRQLDVKSFVRTGARIWTR